MSNAPLKDNQGKPKMALIPPQVLLEVGNCFTFGAIKYKKDFNHLIEPGASYNDMISAAQRHIAKFMSGKRNDTESGYHHLAHAIANLMIICYYELVGNIGVDDRGYKNESRSTSIEIGSGSKRIPVPESRGVNSALYDSESDFRPDKW